MANEPGAPAERTLLGVSICVFRDDEVLMIERGKAPGIGLWAPVGGGIEPGEAAEAAALREVAEETAVACELVGRVGTREIVPENPPPGSPTRIRLEVFAARWTAGEPIAGSDARAARFVPIGDVGLLATMPGVVPWIEAARRLFDGAEA
ncbi:MAG: NUDIX domain-containing protein [Siculibacillus sp.]|nr:NUDIX domain-containing protein [Siculibacillus sp.]